MSTVLKNFPVPLVRLRRLRRNPFLRDLLRETTLTVNDLIFPVFLKTGHGIKKPIVSMPGHFQWSLDCLDEILAIVSQNKIPGVILFGVLDPEQKDEYGSQALKEDGLVQSAIRYIKSHAPEILLIADLCFCQYTSHGHCGVITKKENSRNGLIEIDNDRTLTLLAEQAVSLARAGADMIAPSGMMDGMIAVIRQALDLASFQPVALLSYAAKYASAFYGPFADAAHGAPQFGDRSTHQMDPGNGSRALRECALDIQEGADLLMVKPAGYYLDVIYRIKHAFPGVPLAAYQVSGEFAMMKAAVERGCLNEKRVILESLLSIKRAGADFIITYFAVDAALLLK